MIKNIIIDTDPGVDDAFAIIYALNSNKFNTLGITTVSGNNNIDRVTENTLKLLKFMNSNIKVYQGEWKPLKNNQNKTKEDNTVSVHGDDGLGGVIRNGYLNITKEKLTLQDKKAVDYLIEMAEKYHDITLVTLGPLTNIAKAIQKDPEAMKNIKEIVSMGGGIKRGNVTEYAEFNYWVDPEAAKIVFDFHIPITMVGLNATEYSLFTIEEFEKIKSFNSDIGNLIYEMQKPYTKHYSEEYNINGCRIHDLLAMVIAGNDKIGNGKHGEITIALGGKNRGESIVNYNSSRKNVLVIEDINVEEYKNEFINAIKNK